MTFYSNHDPATWMLAAMLAATSLFIVVYELARKRAKLFDFLSLFHLHFVFYLTLPFVILLLDFDAAANNHARQNPFTIGSVQAVFAVISGYAALLWGFQAKSARRSGGGFGMKPRVSVDVNLAVAMALTGISAVAIYFYSAEYGGVAQAVIDASLIRSGVIEGGDLVFFKLLLPASQFAAFMAFLILYERQLGEWGVIALMLLAVSVILSSLGLLMISGRGAIIIFFATFYLFVVLKQGRFGIARTGVLFLGGVLFIMFGDNIFASLRYLPDQPDLFLREAFAPPQDSNEATDFYAFMRNLQHNVFSIDVALAHIAQDVANLRLFVDIPWGFVALMPSRILPIEEPETIQYLNTFLITGEREASIIPPGLIAFGIYSAWWPGLILVCFAYGWLGRYIQEFCVANWERSNWMAMLFIVIGFVWAQSFTMGEPRVVLRANFILIVFVIYLAFIAHRTARIDDDEEEAEEAYWRERGPQDDSWRGAGPAPAQWDHDAHWGRDGHWGHEGRETGHGAPEEAPSAAQGRPRPHGRPHGRPPSGVDPSTAFDRPRRR